MSPQGEGVTPPRSVRVPTGLWNTAKKKAAKENLTISQVIIAALRAYVSNK